MAITGASSGIGEAAAVAFASQGAQVFVAARREGRLEALAQRCRDAGGAAHVTRLDVRDHQAVHRWASDIEALGGCDIAIANAGVMWLGPLLDMPVEEIEHQYAVNVHGLINTLQAFGQGMRRRGSGILMPVSSVLAVASVAHYGAYCGTKHAVRAMVACLRQELSGSGVDVVHVLPGATESEIHSHMATERVPAQTRQARRVPAAQVADAMVQAAKRPRAEVLCDSQGKFLYWATRISPPLVDALLPAAMKLRGRK